MKKSKFAWIAAGFLALATVSAGVQASIRREPPPQSQQPQQPQQPMDGCYSNCGGEVPWPFEVSNQLVELSDGERYLLIGTVEMIAGRPYFAVDLSKHSWLGNQARRQNPRYPLSGNTEYWLRFMGKRIRLVGMARWVVVREIESRQFRVEVTLSSLAVPAVLSSSPSSPPSTERGNSSVSEPGGRRATFLPQTETCQEAADQFEER